MNVFIIVKKTNFMMLKKIYLVNQLVNVLIAVLQRSMYKNNV